MINISHLLSETVKIRHGEYILKELDIKKDLYDAAKYITNHSLKSFKKDCNLSITYAAFRKEFNDFINYIGEQLILLNSDTGRFHNIFLGDTHILRTELVNIEERFKNLMKYLQWACKQKKTKPQFCSQFLKAFGYKKFTAKKIVLHSSVKTDPSASNINLMNYHSLSSKSWSAYDYIMSLGIKTCPYCNRQLITPIYTDTGRLRADLDHFLPKYRYPFFSMSIYNLVPSCKFCNSSLKNSMEFSFDTHINPFDRGFGDNASFRYELNDTFTYTDGINIHLQPLSSSSDLEQIKGNIDAFKLEELYNYQTDDVKALIHKSNVYSYKMISEIKNILSDVTGNPPSDTELINFLTSNYTDIEDDYHKKPLSKLYSDIVKQLNFESLIHGDNTEENLISKEDADALKASLSSL